MNSVWGSSGSDVFAVGEAGTILHYDGDAWSPMSSGSGAFLTTVWGTSSRDVFAVGWGGTVLHYDGSTWSPMNSGTGSGLWGVWGNSGDDVFAFGDGGTILHYDGRVWAPMKGSTYHALYGGWGTSSSDVFAVGSGGTILHHDGSVWSPMNSGTNSDLWGVWGSSGSDVFIAGEKPGGTILHYDGHAWSPMDSGTSKGIWSVWGTSSSDVFIVGETGTILHYDGSVWSSMDSGTTVQELTTVWGSSSRDVFAVGYDATILHYDGSMWSPMSTSVTAPTAAVAAPAANLPALVKAYQDAYNRHDVDATAGLFADKGCIDWGAVPKCGGSELKDLLRYDAALNSQLEISDCIVEEDHVTCKATERDDCLEARGLSGAHYASVVFGIQDGKITSVTATKMPEDAQRDLLFLLSLAGWAHRTRLMEYKAGGLALRDDGRFIIANERTGPVISALCKEYATVAAAAPAPNPTPLPGQIAAATRVPGSVLFIGDSSSLGLDGLLPKLAASGQPSVTVTSKLVWLGGVPLWKQYEIGNALDDIRQGTWDVVVLQDDLAEDWPGRATEFYEYGRKFDQAIKQAGGETVFYMVYPWGDAKEPTTKEIAAAYSKIGQELGDKVAPVRLAFERALRERPDLNLHARDREHSSWAGMYLEGCVLYATIFGRSPVGLTYRMQGQAPGDWELSSASEREALSLILNADWEISEKDAADLQRIAWETVQDYQAGR